jgi:hypothetical protein
MASGSCTSAVIRSPLNFRMEYPNYADAARDFIRARPDVRSLRFVAATVGRWATGGISQVFERIFFCAVGGLAFLPRP